MNDPKSTKETFHNGWMKTGDILRADEEGFFYLTDRKKELINIKGKISFHTLFQILTFNF